MKLIRHRLADSAVLTERRISLGGFSIAVCKPGTGSINNKTTTEPIHFTVVTATAEQVLVTTIQVSEETQNKLLRVAAELQAKLGHRVSYDEAISVLIQGSGVQQQSRDSFRTLFGSLKNEKKVWKELRELKRSENQRLERLAKST